MDGVLNDVLNSDEHNERERTVIMKQLIVRVLMIRM